MSHTLKPYNAVPASESQHSSTEHILGYENIVGPYVASHTAPFAASTYVQSEDSVTRGVQHCHMTKESTVSKDLANHPSYAAWSRSSRHHQR